MATGHYKTIRFPNQVFLRDQYTGAGTPPTVTSIGDIWADNSDTSYARIETLGSNIVSFGDTAYSAGEPKPVGAVNLERPVIARLRLKNSHAGLNLPAVFVTPDASGAPGTWLLANQSGAMPTTATWVEIPLAWTYDFPPEDFFAALNDGRGAWLNVSAPYYYTLSGSFSFHDTLVYEAQLLVPSAGIAPPCRLFPREDGLGVGGGRIYPPPRSQQRSGRRFGYY